MLELKTSLVMIDDYIGQIKAAFLKTETSFEVIGFEIE